MTDEDAANDALREAFEQYIRWWQRTCPTCDRLPGFPCVTRYGHRKGAPHVNRTVDPSKEMYS